MTELEYAEIEYEFLSNMKIKTRINYQKVISVITAKEDTRYDKISLDGFNHFLLEQLDLVFKKQIKYATYCVRFYILKSFCNFIAQHDSAYENPFLYIASPENAGFIKMHHIPDEKMLDTILTLTKRTDYTVYLYLCILIRCGIRLSDMFQIKVGDISFITKENNVHAKIFIRKGHLSYYAECTPDISLLLKKHVTGRKTEEFLFLNKRHTKFTLRRFENSYKKAVADAWKNITLQDIRNGAIASMLRNRSKQDTAQILHTSLTWLYRYDVYLELYDTDYNNIIL